MKKQINVRNDKNVNFRVTNFTVACKKNHTKKHTINARKNSGFIATPASLKNGYSIKRLEIAHKQYIVPEVTGKVIKHLSVFEARSGGESLNSLALQTNDGLYGVPLYGTPGLLPWPSSSPYFNCLTSGKSNGENIVFGGAENGLWISSNGATFQKSALMCVPVSLRIFENRLFILDADGETIHFSAALDLIDFSAETGLAGSFSADTSLGKVLDLGIYDDKILLIHQYGFSTLEVSFDPANFRLKTLAYSYEEILRGSTQVLGDSIMFATTGGICRATGTKVELLNIEVELASNVSVASIVYANKYFLGVYDKIIVIEKFFDSWSIIDGVTACDFVRVWNDEFNTLAFINGEDGCVWQVEQDGTTDIKTWESDWFHLTYAAGGQYLRQVLVKTAYPVTLLIMNTRTVRRISLSGHDDVQRVNLNLKGDMFKIAIETAEPNVDVTALSAVIGFNNGGLA